MIFQRDQERKLFTQENNIRGVKGGCHEFYVYLNFELTGNN